MVITAETPVRDIVLETPDAVSVLEHFGIDYCCGGTDTLAEACTKRNRSIASVIEALARKQRNDDKSENDWRTAPLGDLVRYIVQKHHGFARTQLGVIRDLVSKVERRHGESHPEIYQISGVLTGINAELTHHFSCEEDVLFPYIEQMEPNRNSATQAGLAGAQQPVARMMNDHNRTGDELRALRELTDNYQPPADACTAYCALYRAMQELELDLHQHIHLENNILFPRVLELEKERANCRKESLREDQHVSCCH